MSRAARPATAAAPLASAVTAPALDAARKHADAAPKHADAAPKHTKNPSGLRNMGLKATGPRLRILELFQTSGVRHLSAEDVYRQLLAEKMEVGLATVYRVLTQFEQAGLLERHHFESGKAVFELNEGAHHDHLVCLQCGRVEEFYDPEIERRQKKIAKERGFALHDHSLSLYADCTKARCPHRGAAALGTPAG